MSDIIMPSGSAARDLGTPAYDPKKHDPFFDGLSDQLADKGFITASADDLITWARTGSLMWMTFGLACCAVEMMQASMPRYDVERFGFAPRASPRQSDVMIVAGVTVLYLLMSMCRVVLRLPRHLYMVFYSYRRKFAVKVILKDRYAGFERSYHI